MPPAGIFSKRRRPCRGTSKNTAAGSEKASPSPLTVIGVPACTAQATWEGKVALRLTLPFFSSEISSGGSRGVENPPVPARTTRSTLWEEAQHDHQAPLLRRIWKQLQGRLGT